MFSNGPSRNEHDALGDLVQQQSRVIELQTEAINALEEHLDFVGNMARQASAELLLVKGIVGGLIAEISGRSDDPYRELDGIVRRVAFVTSEMKIGDDDFDHMSAEASIFIRSYAQEYLRRGEMSAKNDPKI